MLLAIVGTFHQLMSWCFLPMLLTFYIHLDSFKVNQQRSFVQVIVQTHIQYTHIPDWLLYPTYVVGKNISQPLEKCVKANQSNLRVAWQAAVCKERASETGCKDLLMPSLSCLLTSNFHCQDLNTRKAVAHSHLPLTDYQSNSLPHTFHISSALRNSTLHRAYLTFRAQKKLHQLNSGASQM